MSQILFGLFGLAVLIGIAWLFSSNRRAVDWRLVGTGLALQIAFALFVLVTPWGETVFSWISAGFVALLGFTGAGASLIFGDMGTPQKFGFIFAFQVLPTIIFFAAFMSVLYHLGVMQAVVKGMAWVIMKVMRVSGAETLSVCANAFIGQTEAPLVVKPYVAGMTKSELFCLMVGGMATIAGGVMAAYVQMLGGADPESQRQFAKHLLTASIMAAPAALLVAKVMAPETETPQTAGSVTVPVEKTAANVIDAAAAGASDGLMLALNVGAMLLAFTALIALLNGVIGGIADVAGLTAWMNPGADPRCLADGAFAADAANGCAVQRLSLSMILGWIMAPLAWVIGVPWSEATTVGSLIGSKIVLNEFIAYGQLSDILAGNVAGVTLSATSVLIATYALCGFANFSSIAIQLGGIGSIAPQRRGDLARFGLKAVLGGSLATMMTATIAGVISQL
ncbi:nucleoside transporter C-terminal domain-containing protein [Silanimonas sp.]|uniref:NupC/NupG family nucleoside CNT transporter n=1 Tax=Silanimonas sp. TaxID=1929290 RepID=UPI0022C69D61|nr:nucleoside transporter C-terminal domain-containing protein [Silanimonas sp.]MCZ8165977.1 NupC/NupG family nucleoside CNT transporter [Silanimonas sp.]